MPLEEEGTTEAQSQQVSKRDRYAESAGERLRAAEDCQFSLLPYEELARTAAQWYDAAAEAMLRGNFSHIDKWVRLHTKVAAEQGFELTDFLQVLQICRQTAIEKEGWNEDNLYDLDVVTDESIAALRGQVPWEIPAGLHYVTGKTREQMKTEEEARKAAEAAGDAAAAAAAAAAEPRGERRKNLRSKLKLPIRIRGNLGGWMQEEITKTENIARGGVYFVSAKDYSKGMLLKIVYPYSDAHDAINTEYPAEVVRLDQREEGQKGVAVQFTVTLGKK